MTTANATTPTSLKAFLRRVCAFKGCTLHEIDFDESEFCFTLSVEPDFIADDDGFLVEYAGDTALLNDMLDDEPGLRLCYAHGEETSSGYVETWSFIVDPDVFTVDVSDVGDV